jgi:hypothetical protein
VIALYVLGSLYALWLGYVLTMNIVEAARRTCVDE